MSSCCGSSGEKQEYIFIKDHPPVTIQKKIDMSKARETMSDPAFSYKVLLQQIIDAIDPPKPAPFDWKNAKPGMAFVTISGEFIFYIGPCLNDRKAIAASDIGYYAEMCYYDKTGLIRCPERDLTPVS